MAMNSPAVGLADLPYRKSYLGAQDRAAAVEDLASQASIGNWHDTPADSWSQRQHEELTDDPAETRVVEIAALRADGTEALRQVRVPKHPVIDSAFSAFGRGTLIATPQGEIAVEDLLPGDEVLTGTGEAAEVQWIGASQFEAEGSSARNALVRVMGDTFGVTRPHSYLTLGPGARILQTPAALRAQTGTERLLTPVRQFVDGDAVVEVTPQTPVRLFHLMLDRHATIRACGLDCETFHPGATALRALPRSLRRRFLDLFPGISDAHSFGPLVCSRAPDVDRDLDW